MNILFNGKFCNTGYGLATKAFYDSFKLIEDINIERVMSNSIDVSFTISPGPFVKSLTKRSIGYFYWEVDVLPQSWINTLNNYTELWLPCQAVKNSVLAAGYKRDIKIIQTPSIFDEIPLSMAKLDLTFDYSNHYIFYSIFQWHFRKGYDKLFEAYFSEFKNDDVLLIVKTSFVDEWNLKKAKEYIKNIKEANSSAARVLLIDKDLSNEQIAALHNLGNCNVQPHRGEGWGMPLHEAAVAGNLIITTAAGGITEYLSGENIYFIKSKSDYVKNMSWNSAYSAGQKWAEPDLKSLKSLMRKAFEIGKVKYPSFNKFNKLAISKEIRKALYEKNNT